MKENVARENVGMRNPYALADYIDSKQKPPRCKKEWKKILLGLDPKFKDLETALRDSLEREYEFKFLFETGSGSPLYKETREEA